MNSTLTLDQIRAAQANDLAATTAVIEATESRIIKLADKAARRMAPAGDRFAEFLDEFTQVGRITVWESLSRFEGDSVDSFYAFIYSTLENVLLDSVREERNTGAGVDKDAVKVFSSMLEMADGDVYLAEKFAQTVPPKGRRLGADRAQAARLAWQGSASLDVPVQEAKPGKGAVVITLAESLASELGVPEDLIEAGDITREESRVKHAVIHGVLDVMGEMQRQVLKHSFGISGYSHYGHGDAGDDAGLSEELGTTVLKVRDARTKGLRAFAKRYVKTVEVTDAEYAQELTEAAAINFAAGGRK